ncbi:MAG: DUF3108 domain-containing protein [Ignavibacteriaceae bacterium]|nr:DUF3108 domain-containing protein [Ignavibacteriaceae bacterium]
MKKLAIMFLLIPVCFFLEGSTPANKTDKYEFGFFSDKKMQVGEELTYVVSYTFIKLGEIKLVVRDRKDINGQFYYNTVAYINSYSGIPFVSIHQIYESRVNQNYASDFFRGVVKTDKYSSYTDYYFDYGSSKIKIKKGKVSPHEIWTDSTAVLKHMMQDGLSIFYYARMNLGTKKTVNVPCFVNEKYENTKINFYTEVQKAEIDAVDYDVSCLRLDGNMNFISIYGLTGYFEGWFSNDEASIPIIARMKVFLGDVKLELIKWKREGWKPPKYKR